MRPSIFAAIFVILAILPVSAQEITVAAARVHDHGAYTRMVLELSQAVEPSVFTLPAEAGRPYRVVMDFPEINWQVEGGTALVGEGLIAQIRYGRNRPGFSRVVLDLIGPADISEILVLDADGDLPARIVVDLVPQGADAFNQSAGFPIERQAPPEPASGDSDPTFDSIAAVLDSLEPGPDGLSTDGTGAADEPVRARPIIVIDPGHGGRDPGATTVTGVQEKTIALNIGRAMRDALNGTNLFDVYMTRNEDILLALNDRYAIAQDLEADLFVSVHVDSNSSALARGVTVYTLSEDASDDEAARVAERENQSDRIAGFEVDEELTLILIDLAQRETMNLSAELAAILVGSLSNAEVNTVGRPHRFAGFRVLTAPDVPSILLETGFASNRRDSALLVSEAYHEALSRALAEAVIDYFDLSVGGGEQHSQNVATQN